MANLNLDDVGIGLREFLDLCTTYKSITLQYLKTELDLIRDPQDKEHPTLGGWQDQHYIAVGYDAMRIVVKSLLGNRRHPPLSILDFPCGSGRVTRHFRAMFPTARIGACDLYQQHVDFCAANFGAVPLLSKENFDELDIGEDWDLVFCGSLLTHLPSKFFWTAISFISRSLSPHGIAIVTLEGRHGDYIQDHKWKMLPDELFDIARNNFQRDGFGFVDYNTHFKRQSFPENDRYGIALTKPSWLMRGLEDMYNIRIIGFYEREWDDHQDVVVFGRPGVND